MSQIGKNIRKIRGVKNLSQTAFGKLFKASRHNIAAYEEGRATPKLELSTRIARHFGLNLESFLTDELTVNQITGFPQPGIAGAGKAANQKAQNLDATKISNMVERIESIETELAELKLELKRLLD